MDTEQTPRTYRTYMDMLYDWADYRYRLTQYEEKRGKLIAAVPFGGTDEDFHEFSANLHALTDLRPHF